MPSTNKTPALGLNQWVGTDKPAMDDFNADNLKVDTALQSHRADTAAHLSAAERGLLAAPFAAGSYVGNGAATRTLALGFKPRWGLVFRVREPWCAYDPDFNSTKFSLGVLAGTGATLGLAAAANGFTVQHAGGAPAASGTPGFNYANETYCYVMYK